MLQKLLAIPIHIKSYFLMVPDKCLTYKVCPLLPCSNLIFTLWLWGKYNKPMGPKLDWVGELCFFARVPPLHPRAPSLPSLEGPSPLHRPLPGKLRGRIPGDRQAPGQLQQRGGAKSLSTPFPRGCGKNTYWYVIGLWPGERFWKYCNFTPTWRDF